jgi:hypothetical protein
VLVLFTDAMAVSGVSLVGSGPARPTVAYIGSPQPGRRVPVLHGHPT